MTGGCSDRDELGGSEVGTVQACAKLCDDKPSCVSFGYDKAGQGSTCQLSTTCSSFDMTLKQASDSMMMMMWYRKTTENGTCKSR